MTTTALVAINHSPERTGIGPYVGSLARELAARGNTVSVFTAQPHYPEWKIHDGYDTWRSENTENAVRVTRLKHFVPTSRAMALRLLSEITFGLRLLFTRIKADEVILVSPALFSSLILLIKLKVIGRPTTTAWIQDLYAAGLGETGQGDGFIARALGAVESFFLRHVDRVVVIHERFAELVIEAGADSEHVAVVPNWSHVTVSGERVGSEARDEFGWTPDEVVVLHAGNQGVKQGLTNVVEAARLADAQNAPVRFVLLGDGNSRADLEAAGAGISSLQFIDPLDDEPFMRAVGCADILIVNELPGVREMCVPSKLTTYFATGRPVLAATDAESLTAKEVARAGAGVRVDAGDPQSLLDSALELGRDAALAERLGASGLRYRTEVLSTDGAVDAWEKILFER